MTENTLPNFDFTLPPPQTTPLSFMAHIQNEMNLLCRANALHLFIQPIISLVKVTNFPMFITCNAIFFLLIYLPMRWYHLKKYDNDNHQEHKHIGQKLFHKHVFLCALGIYSLMYYIVLFISRGSCPLLTATEKLEDAGKVLPIADNLLSVTNFSDSLQA